jgi:hypothetical protein
MSYKCCDSEFKEKGSFYKHIRSSNCHFLTFNDDILIRVPRSTLHNVLLDPSLLFSGSGKLSIIKREGDKAKIVIVRDDIGGDRISFGRIYGPILEGMLISYGVKLNANNTNYKFSFRVTYKENSCRVNILNRMEANIGLLGRTLPWLVPKLLISPVKLANFLNNIIKSSLLNFEKSIFIE